MRPAPRMAMFVASLLGAVSLAAAPVEAEPRPVESIASFAAISTLEINAERGVTFTNDPIRARATITFPSNVKSKTKARIAERLEIAMAVAEHTWHDDRTLGIRFDSARARVTGVQTASGPVLVVGISRDHGWLPRFYFGEECVDVLPPMPKRIRTAFDDLCAGRTPDLSSFRSMTLTAKEEYLVGLIRLDLENDYRFRGDRVRSYVDHNKLDHGARIFGLMRVAVGQAMNDDLVGALETTRDLQTLVDAYEEQIAPPQLELARRFAQGVFDRLMSHELSLAKPDPARAIARWERYAPWEPADFPSKYKEKLAQLYRGTLRPEPALVQYMAVLSRNRGNDLKLLETMVDTYLEAGDDFRAFATLRYIRERFDRYEIPVKYAEIQRQKVAPARDGKTDKTLKSN